MQQRSIYVGYDSREVEAFEVCVSSIQRRLSSFVPIHGVSIDMMQKQGLYTRPTEVRRDEAGNRRLYDVISKTDSYDGSMATEFAITRFLTPHLAKTGLALFCDCDFLWLCDVNEVFDQVDPSRAVSCVQHGHYRSHHATKMDGQPQSNYAFKNWSSMMVFNCDHPANDRLTIDLVNERPGRELHAFCWLNDVGLVGSLPKKYNHLVGENEHDPEARAIHFTVGGPWLDDYRDVPFAEAWRAERAGCRVSAARRQELVT